MIKTKLTELLGIKHPIIQAGMGPFSNNNLCVATSNKEPVLKTPTRGTLVARGMVGPARWLKTLSSLEHQKKRCLSLRRYIWARRRESYCNSPASLLF